MVDSGVMRSGSKSGEFGSSQKRGGVGRHKATSDDGSSDVWPIEHLALSDKLARPARQAIRAQKARGLAVTYKLPKIIRIMGK